MKIKFFFLPFSLFFISTMALYLMYQSDIGYKKEQAVQAFLLDSEKYFYVYSDQIRKNIEVGHSLQSFFRMSQQVTSEEFSGFAEDILYRNNAVHSVNWVPKILHEQRSAYEARWKDTFGLSEFHITDRDEKGQLVPDHPRDSYFPITYTAPYSYNKDILGVDMFHAYINSDFTEALSSSKDMTVSSAFPLTQAVGQQQGVIFLFPVYKKQELTGFVQLVLRVGDILSSTKHILTGGRNLKVRVSEQSETAIQTIVEDSLIPEDFEPDFYHKRTWAIGGKQWLIESYPSQVLINAYQANQDPSLLIISLLFLFSIFVPSLVYYLLCEKEKIRQEKSKLEASQLQLQNNQYMSEASHYTRHLIEASLDPIFIVSVNGLVTDANSAAEEMTGYSRGDLVGGLFASYFTDGDKAIESNLEAYVKGGVRGILLDVKHKSGSSSSVLYNATAFKGIDGHVEGVFAAARYVGQLLDTMAEKKKVESRILATADFISTLNHELRTALNSILGFTQLLQLEDENKLDAEQSFQVEKISEAGEHLLNLTNQILDLSQIESNKMDINLVNMKVANPINESLDLLQPQLADKKIELVLGNNMGLIVQADKMKFKQVLINFLSNAIKYNKTNGFIYIDIDKTDDGQRVRIAISDTGQGIAKQYQDKIFSAFMRAGQEESEIEGSGIGLLVTKKLVELMHGHIGFESTEGVGSTFWFELPRASEVLSDEVPKEVSKAIEAPVSFTSKPRHILYVEDNPVNYSVMDKFFQRETSWNIQLHCAETAIQAWDRMLDFSFDAVLMDINLPDINGMELTRRLKTLDGYQNVPVIAISAELIEAEKAALVSELFEDYIVKPVDFSILCKALQQHLGKE